MKRHLDKHLIGGIAVCAVLTVTLAFSAVLLKQPTPPAEAATQSMIAQPNAEGSATSWTGYPKPSWGYVNIDETITCNSSDYNFTLTPGLPSTTSTVGTETYRTSLSTIPNSYTTPANDGTGNLIKTSYRIVKVEIIPCLALHLPAPKTSNVSVFYKFAQNASSTLVESTGKPYTITSNLFKQQTAASWVSSLDKYAGSILEVGVRYTDGNGGARVSQMKVKLTYTTVVETVPAGTK